MNRKQHFSPFPHTIWVLAAVIVIVAGMKAAQSLVVPFLLASFISIILMGPLGWLEKKGLSQRVALAIVSMAALFVTFIVSNLIGNSVEQFVAALPEYKTKINNDLDGVFTVLKSWGIPVSGSSLREIFSPASVMEFAGDFMRNMGALLANGFLILLTVIFMLTEAGTFKSKVRSCIKNPESAIEKIELFSASAKHYMAIKAAISACTGTLVAIFLSIVGIDFAILWGLLAFFLNFIPNIGSVLAALPAVLLAIVQFGTGSAVIVAAGYAVLNVVIGNVVEPKFMGQGLGLSTLVVFLSLVFWGWVLGPAGMLLSVPLTMMVKIALDKNPDTAWVSVMLGNGPK